MSETLGILAGAGEIPVKAARNARKMGRRVVVVPLSEARSDWPANVGDAVRSFSLAKAGGILEFFGAEGASEILLIGKVDKSLHFVDMEFDETALTMLSRLGARGDMNLAGVIIDELEARGFQVASQIKYLGDLVASAGVLAGVTDADIEADIAKGIGVAYDLAGHDIGQTVVVRQGAVVAVEAFEHTNETIRRAGKLTGGGFVVVKRARPNQDFRFDVPAVGAETVRVIAKAGGRALAVEAGRTLMIDKKRMISAAKKSGIVISGFAPDQEAGMKK